MITFRRRGESRRKSAAADPPDRGRAPVPGQRSGVCPPRDSAAGPGNGRPGQDVARPRRAAVRPGRDGHRDSGSARRRRRDASFTPCWPSKRCPASTLRWACSSTCRTRWSSTPCCAGGGRPEGTLSAPARRDRWRLRPVRGGLRQRRLRARRRAPSEAGGEFTSDRPQALDHERRRSRPVHRVRHGQSRRPAIAASPRFIVERGFAGFTVGKKEDKLGHSRQQHVRADARGLPRAARQRARRGRAAATRWPSKHSTRAASASARR